MKFRMFIAAVMVSLTSCSTFFDHRTDKRTISSSLMTFLYPDESSRENHKPEMPVLKLPVNVGLAFVPNRGGIHHQGQIKLLEKVKKSFAQYEFIGRIELIPSTYLKGGKGFETLSQVARLHDVEVMALVSYDQVTNTYENNVAFLYWTIVGMYVIPGNENSVQTFVDTAVFDVKSKKLLFRAPGISQLETRTTAVGIREALAEKSLEGFDLAVADMIPSLNDELARFRVRVKEEKVAKVEYRQGYGGGSVDLFLFALVALVGLARYRNRSANYL